MIDCSTVFVLGAGSSIPFGYPSGHELVSKIIETNPSDDNAIISAFRGKWEDEVPQDERERILSQFKQFRIDLAGSRRNSIDFFVQHYSHYSSDYGKIAKILIAKVILDCEQDYFPKRAVRRGDIGYIYTEEGNWYDYLLNVLLPKHEEDFLTNSNIKFITFNYDRSLEHFLYTTILKGFPGLNSKMKQVMDNIPVVHMYGSVGNLPWQNSDGYDYGKIHKTRPQDRTSLFIKAIDQLHLIHEERSSIDLLAQANKCVETSERICFLGCGYAPENLNLIDPRLYVSRAMMGTAYNLKKAEITAISNYFNNIRTEGGTRGNITIGNESDGCLEFLRKDMPRKL